MNTTAKRLLTGILLASLVGTGAAVAHGPGNQGKSGPMAPQMGSGTMMGPGNMMGQGMMMRGNMYPGMMMGAAGMPCQNQTADKDLSADDVRAVLDGHLKWMGHKRLKVGDVKKVEDAYVADITTVDGSLVWKMEVDPKTGTMHHADK